jgi:hypothetical protein
VDLVAVHYQPSPGVRLEHSGEVAGRCLWRSIEVQVNGVIYLDGEELRRPAFGDLLKQVTGGPPVRCCRDLVGSSRDDSEILVLCGAVMTQARPPIS